MRKPTDTRRMLPHKPYQETWYDWGLAIVIALILFALFCDWFGVLS